MRAKRAFAGRTKRVNGAIEGAKRLRAATDGAPPISIHVLETNLRRINWAKRPNHVMWCAVFSLAFMVMLRVSDYTATSKRRRSIFDTRWSDLAFSHDAAGKLQTVSFKQRMWKTKDRTVNKLPSDIVIDCTCKINVCALHALERYAATRNVGHDDTPLFTLDNGLPLIAREVNKELATWGITTMMMEAHLKFSSHSMRKGGATYYQLRGVPVEIIEKLGRWKPGSSTLRGVYMQAQSFLLRRLVQNYLK
jgi:hypothetical protein